jgi:hypothetical protein
LLDAHPAGQPAIGCRHPATRRPASRYGLKELFTIRDSAALRESDTIKKSLRMVDKIPKSRFGDWTHPTWWNMLVTLPWLALLIFLVYQAESNRQIASRERTTQAEITAHEASNHNQFRYVFSIDGRNYSGLDRARGAEPQIGDRVIVHYDSKDPAANALTDFKTVSLENLGPVPALLVFTGAVAWYIAHRHRQLK